MKVNIYYGGRGVMDDPTHYVLGKTQEVLNELRVTVERFNLYEQKNMISTLPQTIKDADAVIFATTVEWLGLGGYMHQFLDACWLYGDKEKIAGIYMQPIVMSTTYGEKEAMVTLENAWEILGGLPCAGFCGYVDDPVSFEANEEYAEIIGKKAENLYRTVSRHLKSLPNSNQAITRTVAHTTKLPLTPQESERLSEYAADDLYVHRQRQDIKELTERYRSMIDQAPPTTPREEYIPDFEAHFVPESAVNRVCFSLSIDTKDMPLNLVAENGKLTAEYGAPPQVVDVYIKITRPVIEAAIDGRMTFTKAFYTGELSAKGNHKIIGRLDEIFNFDKEDR